MQSKTKDDVLQQIATVDSALIQLDYLLRAAEPDADRYRLVIDIQNDIGKLMGRMLRLEHTFGEMRRRGEGDLRKAIERARATGETE